ncbi:MAG: SPFH domain-containing protein [Planctomycetota bacterium]|nr:MAG: SPFH domain-containing protein [Planctomycetota bacterium]
MSEERQEDQERQKQESAQEGKSSEGEVSSQKSKRKRPRRRRSRKAGEGSKSVSSSKRASETKGDREKEEGKEADVESIVPSYGAPVLGELEENLEDSTMDKKEEVSSSQPISEGEGGKNAAGSGGEAGRRRISLSSPRLQKLAKWGAVLLAVWFIGYICIWVWMVERVYVPPGYMLTLTLKIGKKHPDPNLQVMPEGGYQGIQERVLGEGRHFYNPLYYEREVRYRVENIDLDHVAVVQSNSGEEAKGKEFLVKKGERKKGILDQVLTPGKWRLNPYAYKIVQRVKVTEIPPGFVGTLTAKSGASPKVDPQEYLDEAFEVWQKMFRLYPLKAEELKGLFDRMAAYYMKMFLPASWLRDYLEEKRTSEYFRACNSLQECAANIEFGKAIRADIRKVLAKEKEIESLERFWRAFQIWQEKRRELKAQAELLRRAEQAGEKIDLDLRTKRLIQLAFDKRIDEAWDRIQSTQRAVARKLSKKSLELEKLPLSKEKYYQIRFLECVSGIFQKSLPPSLEEDLDTNRARYEELFKDLAPQESWQSLLERFQRKLYLAQKAYNGDLLSREGEQGVQYQILHPGIYYINPKKYEVKKLEIGYRQRTVKNIRFPSRDKFEIVLDISVVWGITPKNAPYLVKRYGGIQEIVAKVIEPQVEDICKHFGTNYTVREFIEGETRTKFQEEFTQLLKDVCKARRINVLIGLVRAIKVPEEVSGPIKREKLASLEKATKVEETRMEKEKNRLVELKRQIEAEVRKVGEETKKMVAEIEIDTKDKVDQIRGDTQIAVSKIQKEVAYWRALKNQILSAARAKAEELVQKAEANRLRQHINAIGGPEVYANYIFTKNLPKDFQIFVRYSGPGTLWMDLPSVLKNLEKAAALQILKERLQKDFPRKK